MWYTDAKRQSVLKIAGMLRKSFAEGATEDDEYSGMR